MCAAQKLAEIHNIEGISLPNISEKGLHEYGKLKGVNHGGDERRSGYVRYVRAI